MMHRINDTQRIHSNLLGGATALLLAASGCYQGVPTPEEPEVVAEEPEGSIDEYVWGLGHLTIPPEEPATQQECKDNCIPNTDKCSYTYYHTTEHFSDFVAFQPNSATLWPGVIVKGEDAQYGLLTPISLPRAPLTFSLSLENLIASPVATMEEPTLSSFRALRNNILQQGVEGKAPASMNLEISQVTSEGSLSRLFKTDVSWGKAKITGMFDFTREESSSQLAVDFSQAYYTIDVDTPAMPSDLFAPEVTLDEVKQFMGVDNPPMYVQSITFGRRSVMSIKTSHSLEQVKTAFSAAIKSVVDVNASVETSDKELIDSLDMKVFVLGGSGQNAVQTISGFEGLIQYIKDGADYSAESPGAPIAYKLAYLDNTGTKFAYTTDFAEASCTPEMTIVVNASQLKFNSNGEGGGKAELTYYAKVLGTNQQPCFLVNQTSEVHHEDGESLPLGTQCQFTFESDESVELTLELWAKEYGGFGDSTKTASANITFVYDPSQRNWLPGINGTPPPLNASNGTKVWSDLSVTLDYSIDQL